MENVIIFCLAIRIFLAIGCAYLSFLISRFPFSSTITYRLFTAAFILLTINYIQSLLYTKEISTFLTSFSGGLVYFSQISSAVFILLIFIGLNRKYFALKSFFSPEEKPDLPGPSLKPL